LKISRSSPRSIAASFAPISSTPYLARTPVRASLSERLSADAVAFFAQGLASLGAGIIELAGLADDDRSRADDED